MNDFLIFSGTSNLIFSQDVVQYLGKSLGAISFHPFPDGETSLQILENVRGRTVFVIQSLSYSPNDYFMELVLMVDALRRASAEKIIAVIPYFGYARQDRKDKPRVPISAKLIANLLSCSGIDRMLTMDLHVGQIQGFFNIPVDNLYGRVVLSKEIKKLTLENLVVMAPDLGAIKIARAYANQLNADFAVMDKRRLSSKEVVVSSIIGDVKNKNVLLVDDMCSTGGTMIAAAEACKKFGARKVYAAVIHGLFVDSAIDNIDSSCIEKFFTSDTVPQKKASSKIQVVSVSELFAKSISCIISNESLSSFFE